MFVTTGVAGLLCADEGYKAVLRRFEGLEISSMIFMTAGFRFMVDTRPEEADPIDGVICGVFEGVTGDDDAMGKRDRRDFEDLAVRKRAVSACAIRVSFIEEQHLVMIRRANDHSLNEA